MRIYQAITTRYIGPTNTRGSRVKATAAAGSVTLHWDCALNSENNHARAAKALADKFKWRGTWYGGGMPNDCRYAFVSCDAADDAAFTTTGEG